MLIYVYIYIHIYPAARSDQSSQFAIDCFVEGDWLMFERSMGEVLIRLTRGQQHAIKVSSKMLEIPKGDPTLFDAARLMLRMEAGARAQ